MRGDSGSVATITLESAALNSASRAGLLRAIEDAAQSELVRAIVLTGKDRVFCVGQDLSEHAQALGADPSTAVDSLLSEYAPIIRALTDFPKPVVVAVNGVCAGGGLGLALAGDVLLAASNARFVPAFSGIGLAPDCGVSQALSFAIGGGRALRVLLQGTAFTAPEALAWGMLAEVTDPGELLSRAHATARSLADGATLALAAARRLLRQNFHRPLGEVLDAEYEAQRILAVTRDHAGAVTAFLAKQSPTFQGH